MKKGETTLKAEAIEEVPPPEEVPAPVAAGAPCVSKDFKNVINAFPDEWVGFNIKDLIVEFLETQLPECQEVAV